MTLVSTLVNNFLKWAKARGHTLFRMTIDPRDGQGVINGTELVAESNLFQSLEFIECPTFAIFVSSKPNGQMLGDLGPPEAK